ncbi:phosphatase PAP2 family protein [Streptomyces kaniharaensis]|uniref:Phosphatase PAP2 family protein n=1 Tax=Streptomyces kaniharaensis TaxID=212423 RepID=A0A6N7KKQ1_9ACTN|nr:phosphatase PAP2 family protein [Streptomyces kaniharaensis]MQS11951.1 phosphatase PAP2 family protein [Streptomyces kaniharaensis]
MVSARDVVRDLMVLDSAVYAAVAATETPALDRGLRRLSSAADHSKLSLAAAGLLALRPGRTRRAAVLGVFAVGLASAGANLVVKQLIRRPRPDRLATASSAERHVRMPSSPSLPSGHTAAAVAFAAVTGSALPALAFPLGTLACAVGYSRVHTGVHYPGDVAAGALIGIASAAAVTAGANHWAPRPPCR